MTATSAVLNAVLYASESAFSVWAYWGKVDGGTNAAAWSGSAYVGSFTNIAATNLGCLATGLDADAAYFFAFRGVNAAGETWATNVLSFLTVGVTIQATDPAAVELGADPGEFTVFRPPSLTNSDLRVYYSLGGTASHGSDYLSQTGSVVIPAGASSVAFAITAIDDDEIEGDETIVVTLLPGGYMVGSPGNATVTITDDDEVYHWHYKTKISFANDSQIGTLTNFPLLVKLGPSLSPGFNYRDFALADGADLRFADGTERTHLHYEVEKWDTNGVSYVWVLVPVFVPGGNIWAYWDNPATRRAICTTNWAAWSSDYRGVWHLGTNLLDSTANRNNGVNLGSLDTTGLISSARSFDGEGGHRVDCGAGASLYASTGLTVSCWIAPAMNRATTNAIISLARWFNGNPLNGDFRDYGYNVRQVNDRIDFVYGAYFQGFHVDSVQCPGFITDADVGKWIHVSATFDSGAMRVYKNGVQVGEKAITWYKYPMYGDNGYFRIGYCRSGNPYAGWDNDGAPNAFVGIIDEVEVQGMTRSSNWIWACWLTQQKNSPFVLYSSAISKGMVLMVR
jgi:hypothetical protein